jgi:hypothetical protein
MVLRTYGPLARTMIFVSLWVAQCYIHDLGSMLWSQFSVIFPNFRQKIGGFLKNQCYDQNLHNLALFWAKNANFFAEIFGENIF